MFVLVFVSVLAWAYKLTQSYHEHVVADSELLMYAGVVVYIGALILRFGSTFFFGTFFFGGCPHSCAVALCWPYTHQLDEEDIRHGYTHSTLHIQISGKEDYLSFPTWNTAKLTWHRGCVDACHLHVETRAVRMQQDTSGTWLRGVGRVKYLFS